MSCLVRGVFDILAVQPAIAPLVLSTARSRAYRLPESWSTRLLSSLGPSSASPCARGRPSVLLCSALCVSVAD